MRLHEAAPKLIIQERLGDKMKVSSYWPVPELTRAELALGRLHFHYLLPTASVGQLCFSTGIADAPGWAHCLASCHCQWLCFGPLFFQ